MTDTPPIPPRLERQLSFIREADRLKQIERRSFLLDGSRRENVAEHSWHLGLMVLMLAEHAADPDLDVPRALKMVLIHDLVEIDAGDTYAYDEEAMSCKDERERVAAERIFGILPDDQAEALRALWEEFEAGETAEARFANAMDRLQPVLANHATRGRSWTGHQVRAEQVRARCEPIVDGAPTLGAYALDLVRDASRQGFLRDGPIA